MKPVNDSKKKIYMVYDLKPDSSLTGGAWYGENDFETEFVDILGRQTLTFLQVLLLLPYSAFFCPAFFAQLLSQICQIFGRSCPARWAKM